MALPASGYLSDTERTNAEMQAALEDQRDVIYGNQLPDKAALRAFEGTQNEQQAVVANGGEYFRVWWDADSSEDDDDTDIFEVTGVDPGRWKRSLEFFNGSALSESNIEDAINALSVGNFSFLPKGLPFPVFDHLTGVIAPDNSGAAKFIKLTAGEDGAGQYNEGLLTNESISGTAPLVEATAEIDVGPLAGEVVPLVNTEESFIRPRETSGALQFDQMQQITGYAGGTRQTGSFPAASGAFTASTARNEYATGGGQLTEVDFDSANSPNARTSSTTSGETRSKNRGATMYMRIV